jgi:hypothetical protein
MHGASFYQECIFKLIDLKFSSELLQTLQTSKEELYYILGCMIYPKKMQKVDSEHSQAHISKVHKTLYQYRNEYLRQLMEEKSMIIIMVLYLRDNGLKRVLSRVQNPIKLEAYITQIEKMLAFCPMSPSILEAMEFKPS